MNIKVGYSLCLLTLLLSACSGLFPQPTPTPTNTPVPPTPTLEPTPIPSPTPLPPTPEQIQPTPTEPALTAKHYQLSLANLMNRPCDLVTEGDALVPQKGCKFGPTAPYPIPVKKEVYFAIFIPEEPNTMDNETTKDWIKLEGGDFVKHVDQRGQMYSCSPPTVGEFVCIVYIITDTGKIPVKFPFRSAFQ